MIAALTATVLNLCTLLKPFYGVASSNSGPSLPLAVLRHQGAYP